MQAKCTTQFLISVGLLGILAIFLHGAVLPTIHKQLVAQVSGPLEECPTYDGEMSLVKNGGFSDYIDILGTDIWGNGNPYFFTGVAGEVCKWGSINQDNRLGSYGEEDKLGKLLFTRHSGGVSSGVYIEQDFEQPLPMGNYTFSASVRGDVGQFGGQNPIGIVVGLSEGSINPNFDDQLYTSFYYGSMEEYADELNLFDYIVYASNTNEFPYGEWTNISYNFVVTQPNLTHLYIVPVGFPPTYPFSSGAKIRGYLGVDNVVITPQTPSCSASSITPLKSAPAPLYYNNAGSAQLWDFGQSISLDETDAPLLPFSTLGYLMQENDTGAIFQRLSNNQISITPLELYTQYSVQDIQGMFSFTNIDISAFEVLYDNDGPFTAIQKTFASRVFDRLLPATVFANYNHPHYIISYECVPGGTGEITFEEEIDTPPEKGLNINVQKDFVDQTLSLIDRQITYRIRVSNINNYNLNATSIVVGDILPIGIQYFDHYTNDISYAFNPQTGMFTIPTLSPNSYADLYIVAKVPWKACGIKTNTASLISLDQEDLYNDNSDSVSISLPSCSGIIFTPGPNTDLEKK